MTSEDRIRAVADFGFTERQARFLVTVMLHSGACLLRQYTAFAGIVHGQKTRRFFETLVRRRYATAYPCRHNRGRVYHVLHKPLYRAIGEPDSRYRRPLSAARVVEGLMRLDVVLANPELIWLATEEEKQVHLLTLTKIAPDKLPRATVRHGASRTVRLFPDRLPVGIDLRGRWVFVYLAASTRLDELHAFVQRHVDLFRVLPAWTLRIVLPPHLAPLARTCQETVRDELTYALRDVVFEELRWYFDARRMAVTTGVPCHNTERYDLAHHAFGAPRFQVLFRRWMAEGDTVLEDLTSDATKTALEQGIGDVQCHVLPHQYRHLSPLLGGARRARQGAEQGEEAPSPPRPPLAPGNSRAAASLPGVHDGAR